MNMPMQCQRAVLKISEHLKIHIHKDTYNLSLQKSDITRTALNCPVSGVSYSQLGHRLFIGTGNFEL